MISRPRFGVRLVRIVPVLLNIIFQNEPLVTYVKFWNSWFFLEGGGCYVAIYKTAWCSENERIYTNELCDIYTFFLHLLHYNILFLPRSVSLHVPLQFYCHFVFLTSSLTFAVLYSWSSCTYFEMSVFASRRTHLSSKIHVNTTRTGKQREREGTAWYRSWKLLMYSWVCWKNKMW